MGQIQAFQIPKVPTSLSIQLYTNNLPDYYTRTSYIKAIAETLIFDVPKVSGSNYRDFDKRTA